MIAVPKPPVHAKDPEFLAWLRQQPCWMCQQVGGRQKTPTETAHIESRRYGDAENAIPVCAWHHREGPNSMHRLGKRWGQIWAIDRTVLGKRYYDDYRMQRDPAA